MMCGIRMGFICVALAITSVGYDDIVLTEDIFGEISRCVTSLKIGPVR